MAAEGSQVAIAWFTMGKEGRARVLAARSRDGGRRFGEPVVVSDANPIGRVDLAVLQDGSLLVSWLEQVSDHAEVRVRGIALDGAAGAPLTVAKVPASRHSGVPSVARHGDDVLIAWVDPKAGPKVKLALIKRVRD